MTENETSPPNEPSDGAERLVIADSSLTPRADEPRPVAARTLAVMAPIVQFVLLALGFLYFVESVRYLTSDSMLSADQRFRIRTNAIALLAFFGLIGWVAAGLLKGAAAVIVALADQARAAERTIALVEGRLAAVLDRLAEALERVPTLGAAVGPVGPAPEVTDPKERHLAEFRAAVRAGHWYQAEELAASFAARYPNDPQGARLGDELAEAKQTATHNLLAKIDTAREVNDPERVLDLRDLLVPLLLTDALRSLDRELAQWCMGLIQKRLRTGTMGADVATLAARVADSLDGTTEAASLRAALPTLRRSAGLCAHCGRPYTGIEDACPNCLSPSPPPASPAPDDLASANGELDSHLSEKDEWLMNDK